MDVMDAIHQFPHCDALVLHAPGECKFCDRHPDWQQLREMWAVNFTGHQDTDKRPCPAELRRPIETIDHWPRNRPWPELTSPASSGVD